MSGRAIDPATAEEIRHLASRGATTNDIARRLGVDKATARKYRGGPAPAATAPAPAPGPDDPPAWKGDGDGATVEKITDRPIRTLEEAVAVAEVDQSVWYVKMWECTAWTVAVKEKDGEGKEEARLIQNYRVWLRLERIARPVLLEAARAVVAELKARQPAWPAIIDRTKRTDPYLLEVDLFDAHFGKLCWRAETGQDYDLKIAEDVYDQAVVDLLAEFDTGQCERVLFPIGNDFMHVDNARNETTGGTKVDTDGRLFKILRAGQRALVRAVERLATVARVEVVCAPGNHDLTFAIVLAMLLEEHFRGTTRVVVDTEPKLRKYAVYGKGLIGFAHGDTIAPAMLPGLMAQEVPQLWGASTWREWHLGHYHKSKKFETLPTDTHNGTVVRYLRSLSATDAWHYRHGFVGGSRAAEAYRWRPETGYAGHAVAHVRGS